MEKVRMMGGLYSIQFSSKRSNKQPEQQNGRDTRSRPDPLSVAHRT